MKGIIIIVNHLLFFYYEPKTLLAFLNFIVKNAIEAYCPYTTSHPQIISVHAGTTDQLFFPKVFFSDSL